MKEFAYEFIFKMVNSIPYYAYANGQAESTSKIIKTNIQKIIQSNPKEWPELS